MAPDELINECLRVIKQHQEASPDPVSENYPIMILKAFRTRRAELGKRIRLSAGVFGMVIGDGYEGQDYYAVIRVSCFEILGWAARCGYVDVIFEPEESSCASET